MNQEFIEAVKAGRIEGLMFPHPDLLATKDNWIVERGMIDGVWRPLFHMQSDHLCAHLRRWLRGKGWSVTLYEGELLEVVKWDADKQDPSVWTSRHCEQPSSELDWHIAAALFCLEVKE